MPCSTSNVASMPPYKQPLELAELKGATKKDPQRYRGTVPKNEELLGEPPTFMSAKAKKIWAELLGQCLPATITAAERAHFEIIAVLMEEMREDPRAFPTSRYGVLSTMLGKLGLNPVDRQRLAMEKAKKDAESFMDF